MTWRRMPFWARLWLALWPPRRREHERRVRAAIEWLMQHPDEPVYFPD